MLLFKHQYTPLRLLLDEAATTDDGVTEATHWLAQERYGGNRALGEQQIAAFGKTKLFGCLLPTSAEELAQLASILVPYPRAAHIYEGWRDGTNSVRVLVDGQELRVVIGAPNALYEWGFGGSGPALLAHALLRHEYGAAVPEHYGQRFATDVIARLPRQLGGLEWLLDSDEIALWFALVRLLEKARGSSSDGAWGEHRAAKAGGCA